MRYLVVFLIVCVGCLAMLRLQAHNKKGNCKELAEKAISRQINKEERVRLEFYCLRSKGFIGITLKDLAQK